MRRRTEALQNLGGHPASRGCHASLVRVPSRQHALLLPPVLRISGSGGKTASSGDRFQISGGGDAGSGKSGARPGDQSRKPPAPGSQANSLSTAEVTQERAVSGFGAAAREGPALWAGLKAGRSGRGRAVTLLHPRFLVSVPPPRVPAPCLRLALGNADSSLSGRVLPSLHPLLSSQVRPPWSGSWPSCAAPARRSRSLCGRETPPATASPSWCSAPCPTRSSLCSVPATGATRGG